MVSDSNTRYFYRIKLCLPVLSLAQIPVLSCKTVVQEGNTQEVQTHSHSFCSLLYNDSTPVFQLDVFSLV